MSDCYVNVSVRLNNSYAIIHYKTILEMVTPCKRDSFNLHPVQINEMLKNALVVKPQIVSSISKKLEI